MPAKINVHPRRKNERAARKPTPAHSCALVWLRRGAALVALGGRGKIPIEKGWRDCPLKTEDEINQLFAARPDANYGIITGAESELICIDVDGPEGISSLRALHYDRRNDEVSLDEVVRILI